MVAPAANMPLRMQGNAHECGCMFHDGVKVRLLCLNPATARLFGTVCVEHGLRPYEPSGLISPQLKVMPLVNEQGGFVRWRQRFIILLETEDSMNVARFRNWLRDSFKAPEPEKKPPSLNDLAEAGEIETLDAG